jgi:acyl carrier protein
VNDLIQILESIRPEFKFENAEDFFADGMLDSFDMVALVSALDEKYGIHIEGTDILPEHFQNVAAIADLLKKYGVTV